MKKLIKAIKDWRDRRFRERIDRVYFRHSGDGMRYIDGHVMVVFDPKTGRDGNIGCSTKFGYEVVSMFHDGRINCLGINGSEPLSKK